MSFEDWARHEPEMTALIPDKKKIEDTGFFYQELMALGAWYFTAVKGTNHRTYINRLYIRIDKKDRETWGLMPNTNAYIALTKKNFGKVIISTSDEDIYREIDQNNNLYDFLRWKFDKVKQSWIVLFPEDRHDRGLMFDSEMEAAEAANGLAANMTKHMLKKYGIQIYKPDSKEPIYYIDSKKGLIR